MKLKTLCFDCTSFDNSTKVQRVPKQNPVKEAAGWKLKVSWIIDPAAANKQTIDLLSPRVSSGCGSVTCVKDQGGQLGKSTKTCEGGWRTRCKSFSVTCEYYRKIWHLVIHYIYCVYIYVYVYVYVYIYMCIYMFVCFAELLQLSLWNWVLCWVCGEDPRRLHTGVVGDS